MEGIFFLVLALLTVVTSIKLSIYGDALSKQTKLGYALVGGLLIASITSIPEFVTSITAVFLDNPSLSFGDILGSNMFNIFILGAFNIILFKKKLFKTSNSSFLFECTLILLEYVVILFGTIFKIDYLFSILILVIYVLYFIRVIIKDDEEREESDDYVNYVVLKFIITSIILIVLSILLTYEANRITLMYPKVSSTTVGAILLGITTSLPEVVSTLSLIQINNNNLAISNILGSNIFNFIIISFSDFFLRNKSIFNYNDTYSNMYLYGGILVTLLLMTCIFIKKKKNIFYLTISSLMTLIYLIVWYFQFR